MRSLLRLFLVIVVSGGLIAATFAFTAPYGRDILTANRSEDEDIDLNQLDSYAVRSYIYASDGSTISTLHGRENRMPVTLDVVPLAVQQSVLAVEDADFYDHNGVNVKANFRALVENVSAGGIQQGGSTITQQLVKNAILNSNQDFGRKSKEASIAIRLEQKIAKIAELNGAPDPTRVAKDVILNKYLNTIYFGSGAYGVQAAAETYWGKPVNELSWTEGAMLAALISNPVGYDPTLHPEAAKKQRQIALDRLVHLNRLTPAEARSFGQAPVPASVCSVSDAKSANCGNLQLPEEQGYFAEEVKQQMLNDPKYNLGADYNTRYNAVFGGGLKVYTTLDPTAQAAAEQAVRNIVPKNDKGVIGVVASVEPATGAVRVLVGGTGFENYKYDIATHQPGRQTGSSFKTFTLITAMEQGNVPADSIGGSGIVLPDKPKPFAPQGPGGNLTSITAASSNAAFVRLNMVVGPQNVVNTAQKLGITSDMLAVPSLTLGTFSTTPLEMASAYSALPNGGVHEPSHYVDRIEDRNGRIIYEHTPSGTRAMSQQSACLTTQILNENTKSGTAVRARLNGRQEAAGKTGTTDKGADTWFVGYTPYLATAVWMGNPENETDNIEYIGGVQNFGGVFPARIWHELNQIYHDGREALPLAKCANTRGGRTVKGEGENKYAFGGDTGQTTGNNGRR